MSLLIEIIQEGLRVEAHRPWPRVIVTREHLESRERPAGRRAYDASRPVGGPRHRQHGAHGRGAVLPRRHHARMPGWPLPLGRRGACAGDSSGARRARSLRPGARGPARRAAVARSWALGGAAPARRRAECAAGRGAVCVPAGRRREPAPDPGRAGACRDHRAGTFPVHRQWRDGGAARTAAGLCPQGDRFPHAGSGPRARRAAGRAHLRRQHGRLCAGVRACGRSGARHHGSAAGRMVAGPDGRARAPRQSSRRFRRHLQRCVVLDHACPNRNPARAHVAGRGRLLRSPADDGWRRSGRRRDRSGSRWRRADRDLLAEIDRVFPRLVELYDNTASLQDRTVATGILKPALARRFGAGGYVGRASGRAFDARRAIRLSALRCARVRCAGARGRRRQCARLDPDSRDRAEPRLDQANSGRPAGGAGARARPSLRRRAKASASPKDSAATILAWLRLGDDGRIARCHLRDPSWFQWPLLEAAIEGNIVADFPLCNKSFNCSYSGHDL